ncbi:MAG TPA: hypothetical protein VFF06_16665, partial [Polyangia bacterium]|nr:hypothetical protein [Polyangia bacterium]
DPPATSAANAINVTVADGAGQNFTAYYIGTNSVIGDQLSLPWTGAATFAVQPLATGSYRLAVLDPAQSKIATTNALLSSGQTYMPQLTGGLNPSDFKAYSATFSLGLVHSTNAAYVSTESYGVLLILPSSQTQAAIPIVPETGFTTTGSVGTTVVPAMPSTIQASAVLLTEMIAFGPTARGELRHQLASPTPASDSFGTAVPDPPAVTVTTPVPSASAITITATPPGSFPISSAFVHVHIHATTPQNYHWHLVAPAGNPTTFVAPGGVIPAGTYSVDTAFVQDFTLADGTVQATLTDDYTKLIRVVPQQLSQSTSTLTVN